MAKITGADKHQKRLRRMVSGETERAVLRALYATGQRIEADAEHSITEGSVSGVNHVPSAPGEPPNADTRYLDTNIQTEIVARGNQPTVHVISHAEYSAALEFGTSKMAERPFMRPAFEKHRYEVARVLSSLISRINGRPV